MQQYHSKVELPYVNRLFVGAASCLISASANALSALTCRHLPGINPHTGCALVTKAKIRITTVCNAAKTSCDPSFFSLRRKRLGSPYHDPRGDVCARVADSRRGDRSRPAQTIRITNDEGDAILSAQWAQWQFGASWRTRLPHRSGGPFGVVYIRDKPFIAFPRRVYPASYDRLLAACAERSLTLDIRQEASTETAILSLASAAMGAAIVNAANRDRPRARVRFVACRDRK